VDPVDDRGRGASRIHASGRVRVALLDEKPTARTQRRGHPGEHPLGLGQVHEEQPAVDEVVVAGLEIMRVFVRLQLMTASHTHLVRRLDHVGRRCVDAIRTLIASPRRATSRVGFRPNDEPTRWVLARQISQRTGRSGW
jgi:hypothetical protein